MPIALPLLSIFIASQKTHAQYFEGFCLKLYSEEKKVVKNVYLIHLRIKAVKLLFPQLQNKIKDLKKPKEHKFKTNIIKKRGLVAPNACMGKTL